MTESELASARPDPLRSEAAQLGSALVLAIFVLVVLTATGIVLMTIGQTEMKMGQASLQSKSVYYLAEAGLEDGRATLLDNGLALTASLQAAAGPNGVIDFDPATVQPVFDSHGTVQSFTGYGDDVPLRGATSRGGGQYLAFLSNDVADADPLVDTNDRVVISGVAAGEGMAFEIVQALVEPVGLLPTPPPCTVTLLGPNPVFDGGDGDCPKVYEALPDEDEDDDADKDFDGVDCDGAGIPGYAVPTICVGGFMNYEETFDDEIVDLDEAADDDENAENAKAAVIAGMNACPNLYDSGTLTGVDTIANLDDPENEPLLGAGFELDPDWTDCFALGRLVERVRNVADYECNDDTCEFDKNGDWESGVAPVLTDNSVTICDGNVIVKNDFEGQGLLVVTGKIELEGRGAWDGPILVLGKGEFVRKNDRATGELWGAIVVANIAGPDGQYGTIDDCTDGIYGFRPPIFQEGDHQRGDTTYCSDDIEQGNPLLVYGAR